MNKNITRRKFLGTIGTAVAATSILNSCNTKDKNTISNNPAPTKTGEDSKHEGYLPLEPVKLEPIACTNCKSCMPCPYGIDIAGTFLLANKNIKENTLPDSKKADYAEKRKEFLISLDRSIPYQRQPNHCIGCYQCIESCPQEITIPDELHKIDNFIEQLKRG